MHQARANNSLPNYISLDIKSYTYHYNILQHQLYNEMKYKRHSLSYLYGRIRDSTSRSCQLKKGKRQTSTETDSILKQKTSLFYQLPRELREMGMTT